MQRFDPVIYIDAEGESHDAFVTDVWSETSLGLIYQTKKGTVQLERVPHRSEAERAKGNYFIYNSKAEIERK